MDFGSFSNLKEDENYVVTYNINNRASKSNYFSPKLLMVFSIIMTLLSVRLKIYDENKSHKFEKFIISLEDKNNKRERYPHTNLLTDNYYKKIEDKYFYYFKEQDEFVTILFKCLENLTKNEPDVKNFLNDIDYFY